MAAFAFNIGSTSDLNADLALIDVGGADGGAGNSYTFNFTQSVTLTQQLYAVNLAGGNALTINGNNATLSGADAFNGLFVYAGTVDINDLTISDAAAAGGNGNQGGGGGAGLGGGLFVASGSAVTLSNVGFARDAAKGGAGAAGGQGFFGGGGGLEGGPGVVGGGGIGLGAAGGNAAGPFSTGGGGGGGIVRGATGGGGALSFSGTSSGGPSGGGGGGSSFSGGGGGVGAAMPALKAPVARGASVAAAGEGDLMARTEASEAVAAAPPTPPGV